MGPCPSQERLSAYGEGGLSPGDREALERHAAACPDCMEFLLHLGRALETSETSARPAWVWRAAAIALVVCAIPGWMLLRSDKPAMHPEAGQAAPNLDLLPEGALGSPETPCAYLNRGIDLMLTAGARAMSQPTGRLRLETGTLWLEARGRENPAILEIGAHALIVREGALCARRVEPRRTACAFLIREARAGDDVSAEVWILDGTAQLEAGVGIRSVVAGVKLLLTPSGWVEARTSQEELEGLREERLLAAAALSGRDPLSGTVGPAPGPYRWVTTLTAREPSAELKLTLPIEGVWYDWVIGMASAPARAKEVVEVTWDGSRMTGCVNGRLLFSCRREELARLLPPSGDRSWKLSAWNGKVAVSQSRLVKETP